MTYTFSVSYLNLSDLTSTTSKSSFLHHKISFQFNDVYLYLLRCVLIHKIFLISSFSSSCLYLSCPDRIFVIETLFIIFPGFRTAVQVFASYHEHVSNKNRRRSGVFVVKPRDSGRQCSVREPFRFLRVQPRNTFCCSLYSE